MASSQLSSGATDQVMDSAAQPANATSSATPQPAAGEAATRRPEPYSSPASVASEISATPTCSRLSSGMPIEPLANAA